MLYPPDGPSFRKVAHDFKHWGGGGGQNVMMMPSLVTCHTDAERNPSSQAPSDTLLFSSGQLHQMNSMRLHHS
jgi:hypothetical protein